MNCKFKFFSNTVLELSSANALSLNKTKIVSSGKRLLPI